MLSLFTISPMTSYHIITYRFSFQETNYLHGRIYRGRPPIAQEIFAASIFCGVSSGQRLQQNSAQTPLRQHSAVAAASIFQTSTDRWPS